MSERYGTCRSCKGSGKKTIKNPDGTEETGECFLCNGEGFSGDAMDYLQKQYDADWEKDRPNDTRWDWNR